MGRLRKDEMRPITREIKKRKEKQGYRIRKEREEKIKEGKRSKVT